MLTLLDSARSNPILSIYDTAEGARLLLIQQKKGHWNRWGPFLSERAWGSVREDYSANGDAWNYFPHDAAPSSSVFRAGLQREKLLISRLSWRFVPQFCMV
jgi:hypothetical protein